MKKCSQCGEEKDFSEFNRHSANKSGFRSECRKCGKKYQETPSEKTRQRDKARPRNTDKEEARQYREKQAKYYLTYREVNRARLKDGRLKREYGLTLEKYESMEEAQRGCCAICNTHKSHLSRGLLVDHCHKTGKVRGLLCDKCNRGLGYLKDSTEVIANAVRYLKGDRPEQEQDYLWLP